MFEVIKAFFQLFAMFWLVCIGPIGWVILGVWLSQKTDRVDGSNDSWQ